VPGLEGYGASTSIVKTYFKVFFSIKILIFQYVAILTAEIASLHFMGFRSIPEKMKLQDIVSALFVCALRGFA